MTQPATGNALKEVRELLKISQGELARRGGLDQAQISRIEHGFVNPRQSMIHRLCRALKVHSQAFSSEVEHHLAELGLASPTEITFKSEILPGRILSISTISRIDIRKNARFIEQVFGMAKERKARKILLDLSRCLCHFKHEEQYQGAKHGLKWMEENSFRPVVAVIANSTLDPFGTVVAQGERHRVEIFPKKPNALKWLMKQKIAD